MDWLELLKYFFLGVIQGFTEVLPVSSSGHVAIFQELLRIKADEGLLFLALVNLGSLIAIVWHFRRFIKRLISGFFQFVFIKESRFLTREDFSYTLKIIIATLPTAIFGLMLSSQIEILYQQYALIIVGFGLLVTSTFLYIVRNGANKNTAQKLTYKDALVIGLLQPFSILPGLSRSGITTASGLSRKASMDTALTFSFMLYLPLSLASMFLFVCRWIQAPGSEALGFDATNIYQYVYYFIAFSASIIATKIALKYVFRLFKQGKLVYFAGYTLVLGVIAFIAGIIVY
ncbi:MAG: undecaprenyl-diphosphate phosphatase [Bacilli bacterium]|nr:undecaprenyl-diphosphate phosphatase [Bacilli bacterium]MBN2696052.1 undecaprenyl-diphosphate phosphatase [Bacilli bacterium]